VHRTNDSGDHRAGKTYTLTGAAALSNAEAMAAIGAALGRPVNYVTVSGEQGMAVLRGMGMDDWLVNIMMSLRRAIAAGYAAGISPDVEQLLGRAPISFERFVADHVTAWR